MRPDLPKPDREGATPDGLTSSIWTGRDGRSCRLRRRPRTEHGWEVQEFEHGVSIRHSVGGMKFAVEQVRRWVEKNR